MKFGLETLMLTIVIFQLLFISLFLVIAKKGNRTGNRLLASVFVLFAISLSDIALFINLPIYDPLGFSLIDDGFILLIGPLFYFYTITILHNKSKLSPRVLIHVLPYFIFTCGLISYYHFGNGQGLMDDIQSFNIPPLAKLVIVLMQFHAFSYLIFSQRRLNEYRKMIKQRFSDIKDINLNWLSYTLKSFLILLVLITIHNILPLLQSSAYIEFTLILFLAFLFYFINKVILSSLRQAPVPGGVWETAKEKYAGSNLTKAELNRLKQILRSKMEEGKFYLNPDLNIEQLADAINIHAKTLSQVINQGFDQNFFDFVNSYRLKEAKELLTNNAGDKMTILEILYQCGFNSKSAFNAYFRRKEGISPTTFKKLNMSKN